MRSPRRKKQKQDVIASIGILSSTFTSAVIALGSSGRKAKENAIKEVTLLQEKENASKDMIEAEGNSKRNAKLWECKLLNKHCLLLRYFLWDKSAYVCKSSEVFFLLIDVIQF